MGPDGTGKDSQTLSLQSRASFNVDVMRHQEKTFYSSQQTNFIYFISLYVDLLLDVCGGVKPTLKLCARVSYDLRSSNVDPASQRKQCV